MFNMSLETLINGIEFKTETRGTTFRWDFVKKKSSKVLKDKIAHNE